MLSVALLPFLLSPAAPIAPAAPSSAVGLTVRDAVHAATEEQDGALRAVNADGSTVELTVGKASPTHAEVLDGLSPADGVRVP